MATPEQGGCGERGEEMKKGAAVSAETGGDGVRGGGGGDGCGEDGVGRSGGREQWEQEQWGESVEEMTACAGGGSCGGLHAKGGGDRRRVGQETWVRRDVGRRAERDEKG